MPVLRRFAITAAGLLAAGAASFIVASPAGAAEATPETAVAPSAAVFATTASEFQCGPNNWVGYLVPDNPPGGANFHPACVNHDTCYSVGSTTPRATCDANFLADLDAACAAAGAGSTCTAEAKVYYETVRTFGKSFYDGSGDPS